MFSHFIKNIKQTLVRLVPSVDGQCDSPVHYVAHCAVTSIDIKTDKVLDIQVVNVKEVKNSQGVYFKGTNFREN